MQNVSYQNQNLTNAQHFQGIGGTSNSISIQPQTPGMIAQATELLRHIAELEGNIAILREKLTGDGQPRTANQVEPASIEGAISMACTRTACLVGETSTILTRF